MLGNPTTTSSSTSSGLAFPSADPNQNQNPDPFSNGPSVYLYGFLATLVLIFLVSIGVAWKGHRTRRVLRARIDEAIARGVLVPGYDPSNPNLPLFPPTTSGSRLRNAQVLIRPVLFEERIGEKELGKGEGGMEGGEGWNIKPTALDVLRPYDPSPLPTTRHPSSHPNSLLNQLLDPLRQYWFIQPPDGVDADQLQGRPGRRRRGRDGGTETLNRLEEEQMEKKKMEDSMGLVGVHEVVASVFIAMPDRGHPTWRFRSAGIPDTGRTGAGVASGSRPSSWQQQQGVASGSRPTSSNTPTHAHNISISTTAVLEVERKEELPELVLGVVLLGLREEARVEVVEEEGSQGKEADVTDGNRGPAGPAGNGKVEGNGGSEKGKEPAVTTPV